VDLPAPFGPINPVTEPRRTESEQLLTAVSPPKRLLTLRTSITKSEDTQIRPVFPKCRLRPVHHPGNFAASAHKVTQGSTLWAA
jgi:hypothetical protein